MWERFVQKEYHLCNTDDGWENYKRKYVTEVQREKNRIQLLHWMNFTWKTFKTVASMKKWSTRESCVFTAAFHRYITCSIPVSGWRVTSSGWRPTSKKTREKQSEVQVNMPRSSSSSRGAFLKNLFRDKGRTNDLTIFEITWNG